MGMNFDLKQATPRQVAFAKLCSLFHEIETKTPHYELTSYQKEKAADMLIKCFTNIMDEYDQNRMKQ